jgi:phosphotransferase system  glucose/maltose/N-acetylglucosamine-specific IIC component
MKIVVFYVFLILAFICYIWFRSSIMDKKELEEEEEDQNINEKEDILDYIFGKK